jgi:hypothetical protein
MYAGRLRNTKNGSSATDPASDSQTTLTYSNSSANGGAPTAPSEPNGVAASGPPVSASGAPAIPEPTPAVRISWLNKKEWESLNKEARPHPYDMNAFQTLLKEGDCTVFRRDQLAKLISTLKSFLTHRGKLKEGASKVYGVKADLAAEVRRLVLLDDVISEKQAAKKAKTTTTGTDATADAQPAVAPPVGTPNQSVGAQENQAPHQSGDSQVQDPMVTTICDTFVPLKPGRCMLCSHDEFLPGLRFCGLHHPNVPAYSSPATRVACTATNARGRQCSNFAMSVNTPKCYLHATELKDRVAIAIEFKLIPLPGSSAAEAPAEPASLAKREVATDHATGQPADHAPTPSTHTAADALAALGEARIPTLVPRATVPFRQRAPTLASTEENKPEVTVPPPPIRTSESATSLNLARLLTPSVVGRGAKSDLNDVAHGSIHSAEPTLNTSRAVLDQPTAPPARVPPAATLSSSSSSLSTSSGTIFSKYESPLNPILTVIKRVLLRQGSTNASFEVPKEHQAAVSMRLNRILLIPMTNTSSPQAWPTSKELYVYLNGAGVTSAWRRNWPARKHSLSLGYLQLDITTQLSRAPTQRLQFDCFKNDYFATLHIVVAGSRSEADVAKAQLRLSLENAQREVEIFRTYDLISGHGRCDDDEIEAGEQTVALKCPVSQMQLNIPVRGASCVHLQCIDLEACLRLLHNGAYWNCPLCDQSMRFSEMRVDTVLFKAIQGRGQEGSLVSSTTAFVRLSDNHRSWQSDDRQRGIVGEAVDDEEAAPSPPSSGVPRGQLAPAPLHRSSFELRRPTTGSGRSNGNSPTSASQHGGPPHARLEVNRKRVRDEGSRDEPIEID